MALSRRSLFRSVVGVVAGVSAIKEVHAAPSLPPPVPKIAPEPVPVSPVQGSFSSRLLLPVTVGEIGPTSATLYFGEQSPDIQYYEVHRSYQDKTGFYSPPGVWSTAQPRMEVSIQPNSLNLFSVRAYYRDGACSEASVCCFFSG